MAGAKQRHERREDYLETILRLEDRTGSARVRDIASAMGVHKSTVSSALKALAAKGFVIYSPYEIARLTEVGRMEARRVDNSHLSLQAFLADVLLMEPEAAGETACRIEHTVDADVLRRLALLGAHLESVSGGKDGWRASFGKCLKSGTAEDVVAPPRKKSVGRKGRK